MALRELITSFFLIFIAEIGDKTQLMATVLSARYGLAPILIGVGGAALLLQGIAVLAGSGLSYLMPDKNLLLLISGILFLLLGAYGLLNFKREDKKYESEYRGTGAIIAFTYFLFAEIGDKTQIATLAKASTSSFPFFTFSGAFLGLLLSNFLGMVAGVYLAGKLKTSIVRLLSAFVFAGFGITYLILFIIRA